MNGLAAAISFYTRLPIRPRSTDAAGLARSAPWFPVVGLGIGASIAAVYAAASLVLPTTVSAVLAVSLGALLTGALHEDGLGDVADAFAGGWTVEQRLEILDDPRQGTFGVLALVAAFLMRVTAVASLDVVTAFALVPTAHALSRVTAIVVMRHQPLARADGLAVAFASSLSRGHEIAGVAIGLGLGAVLIGGWVVPAALCCVVVSWAMAALARRKVGGIGGDVLGAIQQLSELAVLLLGVAVARGEWQAIAW